MTIIGFDFYGTHFFRSSTSAVNNIYYGELKNAIFDELSIRERTDIPMDNVKDTWQIDHRAIFQFLGNLEGGNIENSGLKITKFAIKRRKINEVNPITLSHMDFVNDSELVYHDYTQSNDELIYSVVPVAENGLEGNPSDTSVLSSFVGAYLVDKDTNNVLAFDTAIGNVGDIETQLTQGRTVIETMSRFPQVYYDPREYHQFTLTTAIIPSEFERSGKNYEDVLNNFIRKHIPYIVKFDTGRIFVCDVSNPRLSNPMNTWKDYDFGTISIDFVEVEDYETFMRG